MAVEPRQKFVRVAAEVREELHRLEALSVEWQGMPTSAEPQSLVIRGKGSILHDFYTGLERIFRRIADEVGGGVPSGESWHRDLLDDMRLDLPGVRPPVISAETYKVLLEFLSFRHKFRNIYGFELEPERLSTVESRYPPAHARAKADLEAFLRFLEQLASLPPET